MRNNTRINWLLNDLQSKFDAEDEERKRKESVPADGVYRNEYTKSERDTQARQDRIDAEIRQRGDLAQQSLSRNSDAFEVSKGRMDPALFNMQYGGGADTGGYAGGGLRQKGGGEDNSAQPIDPDKLAKLRVDAYKDYNDMEEKPQENGKDLSAEEYVTRVIGNQQAQQQPLSPWEETRLRNAKEANSGQDTTEDFRAGVSSELMKDGSMRFSDSGPKTEDSRMGWNPEVEAAINKRAALFDKGGAPALANNSGLGNRLQAAAINRQGMGSRSIGYPNIQPDNPLRKRPNTGGMPTDMQLRDDFGDISQYTNQVAPLARTGGRPGMMGSGTSTPMYEDMTTSTAKRRDPKKRQDYFRLMRMQLGKGYQDIYK